jgi:hypothetical protein
LLEVFKYSLSPVSFAGTVWISSGNGKDDKWVLEPLKDDPHGWRITVEKIDDKFWKIFAAGGPLPLPYSSEQGAKLDAWEFVLAKGKVIFATFGRPRLVNAP